MAKYRKKPVVIEATQWFKNGDHPLDYANPKRGYIGGAVYSEGYRRERNWEGEVVRYYRDPELSGLLECGICDNKYHDHGWIDTLEGGHIVCPADWIITGVKGEVYPCKPDIFEMTYEVAE